VQQRCQTAGMHLTHLGHACLLVESAGQRVLIDPGTFSTDWHALTGLDAVLVTHQHPDHLDLDHLPALLAANPDAQVLLEPAVAEKLERGRPLRTGESAELGGGLSVEAVGGGHAVIHDDIPRIGNTGMLLRAEGEPTLLHPGDSYEAVPDGVDVLAVPLNAPWCALKETIDFTRAVLPTTVVPIHDALLSATGRELYLRQLAAHGRASVLDLAGAGRSEIG